MPSTAFYRGKLNENRFVIFIYYECRYAQFALSSVIELPRIPAYYPKTKNTDKNMAEEYILECLLPYFYNRYKRIIVQKIN